MPKINLRKFIKYVLIAIPVLLAFWFFFLRQSQLTSLVRKIDVKDVKVSRSVSASGEIKSDHQASLSFVSTGRIVQMSVEKGNKVKKGQLLAVLDTQVQRETAQSYKDTRDSAIRVRDLYIHDKYKNIKVLGGETEYEIKLRGYNENVSQAEAAYQAQLALLNNSYIYAPFDGTVVEVYQKQGEIAATASPIIELADLDNLVFEISVDQSDFGFVKQGQEVKINLDSYDNYDFMSKINELPFSANAATGSFDLKIPIKGDAEHNLTIGMLGDSYIELASSSSNVKALTLDEIFYDSQDNPYVWVVENTKLKKRMIETGLEGDVYTEIKGEAANISQVVIPADDSQKMEDGYTARIIN